MSVNSLARQKVQSPDSDSQVSCVTQLLQIYGLTISTLSVLMHAQRKNANNGPAPVQKLDWHRSDPVLDRPGPEPVTEPVRSLVMSERVQMHLHRCTYRQRTGLQ